VSSLNFKNLSSTVSQVTSLEEARQSRKDLSLSRFCLFVLLTSLERGYFSVQVLNSRKIAQAGDVAPTVPPPAQEVS
jgi:hypothetical protein